MVLAKENNVFKTVATGSGLFKCTKAYYDAHKNDIPNNTAILITDDAAGGDYVTEDEAQTMIDDALNKSTMITPTANSTYLTITSSNIQKTGKIVTVSVFGTLKAGTNNGSSILTGLPAPTTGNNITGIEVYLCSSSGVKAGYLQAEGSLISWYTVSADESVRINFTYTAKVV